MNYRDLYEMYCRDPARLVKDSAEAVRVNSSRLEHDLESQSETYLHWARLSAIAESEVASVESHTEDFVFADCCLRARQDLAAAQERPTDARVKECAQRDPVYLKQQVLLNNAKRIAAEFKRIESAMWQRRDMLQSINHRHCRELAGLPNRDIEQLKESARFVLGHGNTER